jgi:hypothetical protein
MKRCIDIDYEFQITWINPKKFNDRWFIDAVWSLSCKGRNAWKKTGFYFIKSLLFLLSIVITFLIFIFYIVFFLVKNIFLKGLEFIVFLIRVFIETLIKSVLGRILIIITSVLTILFVYSSYQNGTIHNIIEYFKTIKIF